MRILLPGLLAMAACHSTAAAPTVTDAGAALAAPAPTTSEPAVPTTPPVAVATDASAAATRLTRAEAIEAANRAGLSHKLESQQLQLLSVLGSRPTDAGPLVNQLSGEDERLVRALTKEGTRDAGAPSRELRLGRGGGGAVGGLRQIP